MSSKESIIVDEVSLLTIKPTNRFRTSRKEADSDCLPYEPQYD